MWCVIVAWGARWCRHLLLMFAFGEHPHRQHQSRMDGGESSGRCRECVVVRPVPGRGEWTLWLRDEFCGEVFESKVSSTLKMRPVGLVGQLETVVLRHHFHHGAVRRGPYIFFGVFWFRGNSSAESK